MDLEIQIALVDSLISQNRGRTVKDFLRVRQGIENLDIPEKEIVIKSITGKVRIVDLREGDLFELNNLLYKVVKKSSEKIVYRLKTQINSEKHEYYFGVNSNQFVNKKSP